MKIYLTLGAMFLAALFGLGQLNRPDAVAVSLTAGLIVVLLLIGVAIARLPSQPGPRILPLSRERL